MSISRTTAEHLVAPSYSADFSAFVGAMMDCQPDFDVPYFLEKPFKWLPEAELWYDHGCPTDPEDDAFGKWCEACDRRAVAP